MPISESLKSEILDRDNCRCRACGFSDRLTLEIDHMIPRSLGGLDDLDNLQALCSFCNNTKANIEYNHPLPIRDAIAGFGDQATVTEQRLMFREHIAEIRQQRIDILSDRARAWKADGARTLTIRRRLEKKTTSGIVEEILKNILSASR